MSYSDDLGSDEGECRLSQDSKEAKELALRTGDVVILNEGAGILPVAETETVVIGTSAEVKNDTENNEASDGYDFDGASDENV